MYNKILVPLDGSKRAEAILPHVEQMARCVDGTVILLQVIEPMPVVADPYDPMPIAPLEEINARSERIGQYLTGIADELTGKEIQCDWRVIEGAIVESIIEVADEIDADLIAMASHGRGGLSRVFFGSVASGVLQRADRPLLLVRSREGD